MCAGSESVDHGVAPGVRFYFGDCRCSLCEFEHAQTVDFERAFGDRWLLVGFCVWDEGLSGVVGFGGLGDRVPAEEGDECEKTGETVEVEVNEETPDGSGA